MSATCVTPQIATATGYTFVCYARDDEPFAITVAEAMRARAVPIWLDQWNIQPGADWSKAVDEGLNGCANVLIVLSPAAVASDEVASELRAALDSRKRIIPLLYRRCEIPIRLRLKQHIDCTGSQEVSDRTLDRLARAVLGRATNDDVQISTDQERKGRRTLLQDVSEEAAARLRLLGAEPPVSVVLEYQPHQVARTWDDEVVGAGKLRPAAPTSDIVAVFDDSAIGGTLLILGAAGSGKTTVLPVDAATSRPSPVGREPTDPGADQPRFVEERQDHRRMARRRVADQTRRAGRSRQPLARRR